ncbi:MAG: hypothetical protein PF630_09335 [Gammaproteobacteria bacterium]|jgi:hypothetical protein|nr:hypothetical protein [Gammaproteobacteria bacterium]
MNHFAEIIIAALELMQAELRLAKRQFLHLGIVLGIVLAAAVILACGALLLLYAVYVWLSVVASMVTAALLTGLLALVFALLLFWLAHYHATRH